MGNMQGHGLITNQHNLGPLVKRFGDMIGYDAGSNLKAKIKEFIVDNRWNMLRPTSSALLAGVCA